MFVTQCCLGVLGPASILGRPCVPRLGNGAFCTPTPTYMLPCICEGTQQKTPLQPIFHNKYEVAAAAGGEVLASPQGRNLLPFTLPPVNLCLDPENRKVSCPSRCINIFASYERMIGRVAGFCNSIS